jgi:hypothetical protein
MQEAVAAALKAVGAWVELVWRQALGRKQGKVHCANSSDEVGGWGCHGKEVGDGGGWHVAGAGCEGVEEGWERSAREEGRAV